MMSKCKDLEPSLGGAEQEVHILRGTRTYVDERTKVNLQRRVGPVRSTCSQLGEQLSIARSCESGSAAKKINKVINEEQKAVVSRKKRVLGCNKLSGTGEASSLGTCPPSQAERPWRLASLH